MCVDFVEALSKDDLTAIKASPKTDIHSHSLLSTRLENIEHWVEHPFKTSPF